MTEPSRIRGGRAAARRAALGLTGVAVCVLAAQALGLVIPAAVLPRASTVLARMAGLAGSGQFLAGVTATLEAWAAGLALTVAVAVPAGVILGSVPGVRYATRAVTEFLRPVPPVALIGLAVLLFGSGLHMMLALIVYGCCWPVLFTTITGLESADPVAADTLRAFGFGRLAVIRRVALPGAAPFIATGIRIASAIALILDIGAGYLTGQAGGPGIGAFIAGVSAGAGSTPLVLAATCWTGLLGLALDTLLGQAERWLLPWHRASLGLTGGPAR